MKRNIILTGALIVSLFLITSASFSQLSDYDQEVKDGKKIVEAGKVMMGKGTMLKNCDLKDKRMVEQLGESMIKEGAEMMESGMMIWADKGKEIMTDNGMLMMESGRMLMKMGKMKSESTSKEKNEIVKQGELMIEQGKLMVGEAQPMK